MEISRESLLEYLAQPDKFNCKIKLQYATIASKSYGTEKRFFVPAPIITLAGDGWLNKREQGTKFYRDQAKKRDIDASSLPDPQIEGLIGIYDVEGHPVLDFFFSGESNTFVAKTIYIRHTENRNFVRLALEFKYNNGCRLGSFLTDRIKIISKASKAKSYSKSPDFKYSGICSGQEICLSNRPKVPPVTRFITADAKEFSTSTTLWTPLTIHLVDTQSSLKDDLEFGTKDGPIHYNDIVRLVDKASGISLPRLRVCKVIHNDSIIVPGDEKKDGEREVLNQMQKVVLQMVDDKCFTYIVLDSNGVSMRTEKNAVKGQQLKLNDIALFLIYSVSEIEQTFYELNGPTMQEVLPSPICTSSVLNGFDIGLSNAQTEVSNFLMGSNFSDNLSVWLGTIKCKTIMKSTELIEFIVPKSESFSGENELFKLCKKEKDKIQVPILLIRDDAVIFPTGLTFNYRSSKLVKREIF